MRESTSIFREHVQLTSYNSKPLFIYFIAINIAIAKHGSMLVCIRAINIRLFYGSPVDGRRKMTATGNEDLAQVDMCFGHLRYKA